MLLNLFFFSYTDINNLDHNKKRLSQCHICKLIITSVNLWRHIRTQHTAQPKKKCNYCKKEFKNKYSLREHVRIAHENRQLNNSEQTTEEPEEKLAQSQEQQIAQQTNSNLLRSQQIAQMNFNRKAGRKLF